MERQTIKLQTPTDLTQNENVPKVPGLVREYLSLKNYKPEGQYFRISIDHESNPNTGAGIARMNELKVERRKGKSWKTITSTGMVQYRGAHAHEIDNKDQEFSNPTVLKEANDSMVYAYSTGEGNVKVIEISKGNSTILHNFNKWGYDSAKERVSLAGKILRSPTAFLKYMRKDLYNLPGKRWFNGTPYEFGSYYNEGTNYMAFDPGGNRIHYSDKEKDVEKDANVVIVLAQRHDRDANVISDAYVLYVWIKDKGLARTDVRATDLRHPGHGDYKIEVELDEVTLVVTGPDFVRIALKVVHNSQQINHRHNIRFEWEERSDKNDSLKSAIQIANSMDQIILNHLHDHPNYKFEKITESVISEGIAAWIMFEQIDTDRGSKHGEGWLGDQFRYSIWVKKQDQQPERIHEDHAYIRPRTKSEVTGTLGRDCTIKELKLTPKTVEALCRTEDNFENQKWEKRTFNLGS